MHPFGFLPLVTALSVLCYGFFVLYKNPRSHVNISFALTAFMLFLWQFGTFMLFLSVDESAAFFWHVFIMSGASFIPATLYHFSVVFLKLKVQRKFVPVVYVASGALFMSVSNSSFSSGVHQTSFGYYVSAGPLYFLEVIFIFSGLGLTLFNFYKEAKKLESHSVQHLKLNHIFWAVIIGMLGGIDFLPAYGVEVYPFGSIFLLAFVLISGRAIIKYRFMDIETFMQKALERVVTTLITVFIYTCFLFFALHLVRPEQKNRPLVLGILLFIFLLLFDLFRNKIQAFIDNLLYKERHTFKRSLDDFVKKLNLLLDLDELVSMIVKNIAEVMRIDRVSLMLLDEEGNEYVLRGQHGMSRPRERLGRDDPFTTWILSQRKIVEKEQIALDPWYSRMKDVGIMRFDELEAELCVPLIVANNMIGMLNLGRKTSGEPYKKDEMDVLSSLAVQSAIAVSNALTYNSLKSRTNQLRMLSTLGQEMGQSLELGNVTVHLIERTKNIMHADAVSILLKDEKSGELVIEASSGINEQDVKESRIKMGEKISGWVADCGQATMVFDVDADPRFKRRNAEKYYKNSLMSVPLMVKGRVIGVVNVNSKNVKGAFGSHDLELLKGICGEASAIIENARLYTDLRESYLRTIQALAQALETKDKYTYGHSARVTSYSVGIAKKMQLKDSEIEHIATASLLHDLGKIGIEDSILLKTGRLTEIEYEKVKNHPAMSEKILRPIGLPEEVLLIIRHHHEWYNGKGYPDGLKEKNISIGARVLAVADAYDAMTSDRPYRKALSQGKAIEEIKKYNYEQFDPDIVGAFLKIVSEEGARSRLARRAKDKECEDEK